MLLKLLHNTQIAMLSQWVFRKMAYSLTLFPLFIESVCRKLGFGRPAVNQLLVLNEVVYVEFLCCVSCFFSFVAGV